jgi:hypothetical protein
MVAGSWAPGIVELDAAPFAVGRVGLEPFLLKYPVAEMLRVTDE